MNVRYRWADITACALLNAAAIALVAAIFEGIPV